MLILVAIVAGAALIWCAYLTGVLADAKSTMRREVETKLDEKSDVLTRFNVRLIRFMEAQIATNAAHHKVMTGLAELIEEVRKNG